MRLYWSKLTSLAQNTCALKLFSFLCVSVLLFYCTQGSFLYESVSKLYDGPQKLEVKAHENIGLIMCKEERKKTKLSRDTYK